MSKPLPLDIVEKVGGLILTSDYRSKVDVSFQYELADLICHLMAEERERVARYVHRNGTIHDELADQVCDEEGEKWHVEMRDQLYRLATEIRGGLK
jgi:hypothetical protein